MAKHDPFLSAADSARLDSWMVDIAADELGKVTESVFEDDHVLAERALTATDSQIQIARRRRPVVIDLLARLTQVRKNGSGWTARCPGHEDRKNSLSMGQGKDGRWLLKCHAGCDLGQITAALGIDGADRFDKQSKGGGMGSIPSRQQRTRTTTQQSLEPAGNLAAYGHILSAISIETLTSFDGDSVRFSEPASEYRLAIIMPIRGTLTHRIGPPLAKRLA